MRTIPGRGDPRVYAARVEPEGPVSSEAAGPVPAQQGRRLAWSRDGMPPWIPRLMLIIVATMAFVFFGLAILRQLRSLLVMIFIALFLSVALEPAVNWLAKRGWRRGAATGVIFLILVTAAGTFIASMIPLIVDQTLLLIDRLPGYVEDLSEFTARFGLDVSPDRTSTALNEIDTNLQALAADVAGSVFGVGSRLLTTVFQLLTIALFTFYLTAEGPRFRRAVLSVFPPHRQREIMRVWEIAIDKTGGYFYSRALLAAVAATVTWVVLRLIDVPFALPLALWVGIWSQFVPVVGTYIGGALPTLIALLESPGKAIAVVVFVAVYQQVENYLLSPRVTARTMSLHPAISFGSAIAGGTLLGAPGALMALPAAATIQAFISTYLHRYELVPELVDDLADADRRLPERR